VSARAGQHACGRPADATGAGDQYFAARQAGRFPVHPPALMLQAHRRVQIGANSGDQCECVFRHSAVEDTSTIGNGYIALHKGGKEQRVNAHS
jgi:hypothetical protein